MTKTSPAAKPALKKPMAKRAPLKIIVGRTYHYTSRTVPASDNARGKVTNVKEGVTGGWVTLHDAKRGRTVTIRPSQVLGS